MPRALLILFFSSIVWAAKSIPPFPGSLVYNEGVLSNAAVDELTRSLGDFQKRTGHQFVVALFQSLGYDSLEGYSSRVFNAWKIGDKERNDGLLLCLFRQEGRWRIEVGLGLQGVISNDVAAAIGNSEGLPYFKKGDFDSGVLAIVRTLEAQADKTGRMDSPGSPVRVPDPGRVGESARGSTAGSRPSAVSAVSAAGLLVLLCAGALLALKGRAAPGQPKAVTTPSPRQDGDAEFYYGDAEKICSSGAEHEKKGQHEAALKEFSEAIRLDPKRAAAYLGRAKTNLILGRIEEALADFGQAIFLDPTDPAPISGRGMLLANIGRLAEAKADCERLKTIDPSAASSLCDYLNNR
ncbi:MAG: TPM domain-containing protein [Elusimicrobia bacterium]|nr:TPM domain-containing protein [Elusimicrobiota bacterium]